MTNIKAHVVAITLCLSIGCWSFAQEAPTQDLTKSQLIEELNISKMEVNELKAANKQQLEVLERQRIALRRLESKTEYYEETLDLRDTFTEAANGNFSFAVKKVSASRSRSQLIIEGFVTNLGGNSRLQVSGGSFTDPKGNKLKSKKFTLGGNGKISINPIQKDLPIKFEMVFEALPDEIPTLSVLEMRFYHKSSNSPIYVQLEDLPVLWFP